MAHAIALGVHNVTYETADITGLRVLELIFFAVISTSAIVRVPLAVTAAETAFVPAAIEATFGIGAAAGSFLWVAALRLGLWATDSELICGVDVTELIFTAISAVRATAAKSTGNRFLTVWTNRFVGVVSAVSIAGVGFRKAEGVSPPPRSALNAVGDGTGAREGPFFVHDFAALAARRRKTIVVRSIDALQPDLTDAVALSVHNVADEAVGVAAALGKFC